ncbi:MAG: exo-alpha-sialidase [Actinobacteria bacterium]|nr:MAG: exo-alpha-sialidase [Actinomycetota bacterium]
MRRPVALLLALVALGVAIMFAGIGGSTTRVTSAHAGQLGIDDELNDEQERLISGFAAFELGKTGNDNPGNPTNPDTYVPRGSGDCTNNVSSNIKVNQNCLNLTDPNLQGRGQAQNETSISVDPNHTQHLVASYNDYRRGDGTCGTSWSTDGGRTWNDSTVPNNFTRNPTTGVAPRIYWEAGGDTSVAWDSKGNAYLSCQLFQRGPATAADIPGRASGFFVFRSTQNGGASWNFTGRPVFETGVQRSFLPLEDKQFMAVDNNSNACAGSPTTVNPGSTCTPFQDRIYVTWTEFAPNGSAFIYEAYSSDYGEHFSPRHLVSLNSSLCPNDYGLGTASSCNENQFSQPFVGKDGALYVIYNNFNNPETLGNTPDNRNQILLSKSVDGGNTFSNPVKVSDYYDLPDCATYQQGHDFGRACVPEKNATANSIFRATNYGSGEVNPTNPNQVVVTFGSYINQHSKESNGCAPTGFSPATGQDLYTGVKTPGACNNDILVSVSNNGGASFTGTTTDPRALPSATTDPGQATSDQFWQWIAFTKTGKLATSYYDRQYGSDEATGYSDISLSSSGGSPTYAGWNVYRITNVSMPFPTQFPEGGNSAGSVFYGDYAGLDADTLAHPFWSDTRNPDLFLCPASVSTTPAVCGGTTLGTTLNDQEAYTANQSVSSSQ